METVMDAIGKYDIRSDTRETIEEFSVSYVKDDLLDRYVAGEFDKETFQQKLAELSEGFKASSLPGVAIQNSVE